jgi:long-chain acyl-CoA synthetase
LENFNDLISQSDIEPEIEINDRDLAYHLYPAPRRGPGAMHCHLAVVMAVMSNCIEMELSRDDGITGHPRSTAPASCC